MRQKEVGIFEAKTHLSEILDKVSHGSKIVITNRGRPIARLVPFRSQAVCKNRKEVIARFAQIRNSITLENNKVTIKELIEEGRGV